DRKQLNPQGAADILKTASPFDPAPPSARADGHGVISTKSALVMIAAATRVAGSNPVRINRNISIILEPLCGADGLASLFNAALLDDSRMLLGQLRIFGDFGGEPDPGRPQFPPRPFPCPDGPPWPPHPEPRRPLPFDDRGCSPAEARDAFRAAEARRRTYSIMGISPERACPGEIVTITGSGFLFEGHTGAAVHFPGLLRGSSVPSEAPLSWTDTEIRVVVPEGVWG